MLRFLTRLAAKLPTVAVMTRFAPLVALAAGCISAAVALYQFQSQVAINRISATFALNAQYWSEIRNGSITIKEGDRLEDINEAITERTICQFQVRARLDQNEQDPYSKVANCSNASSASRIAADYREERPGQSLPADLEKQIREALFQEINLEAIVGFLGSVAVCVEVRGCNGQAAHQLFQAEMTTFVRMLCGPDSNSQSLDAARLRITAFLNDPPSDLTWPGALWHWVAYGGSHGDPVTVCKEKDAIGGADHLPAAGAVPHGHTI